MVIDWSIKRPYTAFPYNTRKKAHDFIAFYKVTYILIPTCSILTVQFLLRNMSVLWRRLTELQHRLLHPKCLVMRAENIWQDMVSDLKSKFSDLCQQLRTLLLYSIYFPIILYVNEIGDNFLNL